MRSASRISISARRFFPLPAPQDLVLSRCTTATKVPRGECPPQDCHIKIPPSPGGMFSPGLVSVLVDSPQGGGVSWNQFLQLCRDMVICCASDRLAVICCQCWMGGSRLKIPGMGLPSLSCVTLVPPPGTYDQTKPRLKLFWSWPAQARDLSLYFTSHFRFLEVSRTTHTCTHV